jgi:uncharacterized protein (DUF2141 family)
MPMFGLDSIHDKSGKLLSEILEEIKSGVGGGNSPDLKDYAKVSDVKAVKDMIEGLITDLKAGKYNVASEVKNKEEVKEDTKTEK